VTPVRRSALQQKNPELHDIHPRTVAALPELFAALRAHGYRLVHVVPADTNAPTLIASPRAWPADAP
jgi:peptidoglycan-N-acetylglucosamine deacetylase